MVIPETDMLVVSIYLYKLLSFLSERLLPGTLGRGSPGDVMFIDPVLMYAPVAPLGGGAMVMRCQTSILWISSSGAPLAGVLQ
jgi:hypothetical protein